MTKPQPINPVQAVAGVRWGVAYAGIKQSAFAGADTKAPLYDLALMELAENSTVSAVFTRNAFSAAPVKIARERLQTIAQSNSDNKVICLINSGNANAGTGLAGHDAALQSCRAIATALSLAADQVLPFSTGVIGELLPAEKIAQSASTLCDSLDANNWGVAAQAIMTTDTVAKTASRTLTLNGQRVTLSGICKGAGMIRPNMATMLAYIATDADVSQADLDTLLAVAVNQSFNRITVDGDTSTNDACVLAATGQSGVSVSSATDGLENQNWASFQLALNDLLAELATAIIRDAEGASKFITIDVVGGGNDEECLSVAYTVAESPLVKTAFFASDANWGRILAAIGRADVSDLDVERVEIYLDELLICEHGGVAVGYQESRAMEIMGQGDISVTIKLNRGDHQQRVWTSDLSLDYVRINADYRS